MPKIIRALSALLTILVVAFAVGACGGDDESSSSGSSSWDERDDPTWIDEL